MPIDRTVMPVSWTADYKHWGDGGAEPATYSVSKTANYPAWSDAVGAPTEAGH